MFLVLYNLNLSLAMFLIQNGLLSIGLLNRSHVLIISSLHGHIVLSQQTSLHLSLFPSCSFSLFSLSTFS
ncbi:hypothetical protein PENTCL1PPCAC_28605, partial [Pristionchus entomophagus]